MFKDTGKSLRNLSRRIEIRRHSIGEPWTYEALDFRQREIAEEVRLGQPGALLLSEVAPVITLGRRTERSDIYAPLDLLKQRGIELYPTDRGGLATYHGPGQWVVFAVDHLESLTGDSRGIRLAIEALLEIAREVASLYQNHVEIRSGAELGVWTPRGKVASVGVHVERRILLHGLAINGFRTPQSFFGLRPCGLDAPVDFLFAGSSPEKNDEAFSGLAQNICEAAARVFGK